MHTSKASDTTKSATKIESIKKWILTTGDPSTELGLDTDIIAAQALDSLQMVNLILFIEELKGEELREEDIQPKNFRTLRVIHQKFLSDSLTIENEELI